MEYTDDEFIEYIDHLEKALDKACDILTNERIDCYKDCPFEHKRNRDGTCKGLCESKSKWKEWLMKDE